MLFERIAMRIDVVGLHGLSVTEPIESHARDKSQKLLNHFEDYILSMMYRLEVEDAHGQKLFKVEATVSVRHHDDIVAIATGDDLYLAVDAAVNKTDRQLRDFKDRQREERR